MKTVGKSALARSTRSTHVALLRGVNVGGKNKLPMRDLAEIFNEAGALEVRTYIQSGNVVFSATDTIARKIGSTVPKLIGTRLGFAPPVVLRSADELAEVAGGNPFLRARADEAALYVGFLADTPDAVRIVGLNPNRSPGDRYELRGRDIYMHLVTGAADTKLTTAYFDSTLATISTFRNWRTVLKLLEMTRETVKT